VDTKDDCCAKITSHFPAQAFAAAVAAAAFTAAAIAALLLGLQLPPHSRYC